MGMESLVTQASKFSDDSVVPRKDIKIKIIGAGGAGGNSLSRLDRIGIDRVTTLAINTDEAHLRRVTADVKKLIGGYLTRGLGAGGDPDIGRRAALESKDLLRRAIGRNDLVFVTAGLGGGTGTGSLPVIVQIAKEQGAIVIALVTTPFNIERYRLERAHEGLDMLKGMTDSTIVLDNNRLLKIAPKLPIDQAFGVMDQLISEVIRGLTDIIGNPSLINVDFADVKSILCTGGTATILYGEGEAEYPEKVVMDTLKNPLLDIDYTGAKGVLIHITCGQGLELETITQVVEGITKQLDPEANVIFGIRIDAAFEGRIKVIAIMNGVHSSNLSDEYEINRQYVPLHQEIAEIRVVN